MDTALLVGAQALTFHAALGRYGTEVALASRGAAAAPVALSARVTRRRGLRLTALMRAAVAVAAWALPRVA
ncbi:hypothetical protein [Streptomyces sp. CC210A]|uniref:hypothetical protein n=1 Tax=Streptomyces sp. CC210A TaxID=2898184 RepID=UPI001F37D4A6|nr:hypothetical protein [Streptomyces sp. CC210A]